MKTIIEPFKVKVVEPKRRALIDGYRIISQPKFLRHFTAQFAPLEMSATA